MSKYGIVLKVGKKWLYLGMTRKLRSTQVHNVTRVPKEWVQEDLQREGQVLETPGCHAATVYRPGGPGGGGSQIPLSHDLLELRKDLKMQVQMETHLNAAEEALELVSKPADREETARRITQAYLDLHESLEGEGKCDWETVPEIADHYGVHERTLYRIIKARVSPEDRILPEMLKESQEAEA